MTPEAKAAALARLAADTKTACATSADVAKAAKAKAAAKAAHAAQAAKAAKAAQAKAEAAQAAKAANLAKVAKTTKAAKAAKAAQVAVNPVTKGFSYHAKAAFLTHPVYFSLAGGVIIGIVAYKLVNKFLLNKEGTAELSS